MSLFTTCGVDLDVLAAEMAIAGRAEHEGDAVFRTRIMRELATRESRDPIKTAIAAYMAGLPASLAEALTRSLTEKIEAAAIPATRHAAGLLAEELGIPADIILEAARHRNLRLWQPDLV